MVFYGRKFYNIYRTGNHPLYSPTRCGLRMPIMHQQHLLDSVQILQDSSLANQVPPPQ